MYRLGLDLGGRLDRRRLVRSHRTGRTLRLGLGHGRGRLALNSCRLCPVRRFGAVGRGFPGGVRHLRRRTLCNRLSSSGFPAGCSRPGRRDLLRRSYLLRWSPLLRWRRFLHWSPLLRWRRFLHWSRLLRRRPGSRLAARGGFRRGLARRLGLGHRSRLRDRPGLGRRLALPGCNTGLGRFGPRCGFLHFVCLPDVPEVSGRRAACRGDCCCSVVATIETRRRAVIA